MKITSLEIFLFNKNLKRIISKNNYCETFFSNRNCVEVVDDFLNIFSSVGVCNSTIPQIFKLVLLNYSIGMGGQSFFSEEDYVPSEKIYEKITDYIFRMMEFFPSTTKKEKLGSLQLSNKKIYFRYYSSVQRRVYLLLSLVLLTNNFLLLCKIFIGVCINSEKNSIFFNNFIDVCDDYFYFYTKETEIIIKNNENDPRVMLNDLKASIIRHFALRR